MPIRADTTRWASRARLAVAILLIAGLLQSCASYHHRPIDADQAAAKLDQRPDTDIAAAAAEVDHPVLRSVPVDLTDGINADEAALLAVVMNPQLRADRDKRGLARAQLLQAGILPNPVLDAGLDIPTDGNLAGTGLGYSVALSWDFRRLVTRGARVESHKKHLRAVVLAIAWKEWQAAQAARLSAMRIIGLVDRVKASQRLADELSTRLDTLEEAMQAGDATALDVASVRSSVQDVELAKRQLQQKLARQRLTLNAAIGVPPDTELGVQQCATPWDTATLPDVAVLVDKLQGRRLDLMGLRRGYQSQEAAVREAILGQFPSIGLGVAKTQDTSFVGTIAPSVTLDVPLFDRNQGAIATERATRQKLYDTYLARLAAAAAKVADFHAQFEGTNRRLDAAQADLQAVETLVDLTDRELGRGEVTVLEAAQLRDRRLNLELKVAELRQSRDEAAVGLEIASGTYLQPAACGTAPTSGKETQ